MSTEEECESETKELLEALENINDRKNGLAQMLKNAKLRQGATSLSSLQRIEDRILEDEVDIQSKLVKLRAKRARMTSLTDTDMVPAPAPASSSSLLQFNHRSSNRAGSGNRCPINSTGMPRWL